MGSGLASYSSSSAREELGYESSLGIMRLASYNIMRYTLHITAPIQNNRVYFLNMTMLMLCDLDLTET